MKKTFYTPAGKIVRELTAIEIDNFAAAGDIEAKKEQYKKAKKDTFEERLSAVESYCGLR